MRLRATSPALLALSLASLAVVAAACSGGGSKGGSLLRSGSYAFTADTVDLDECWPDSQVFPPTGIALPFTLTASSTKGDATLTLTPAANVAAFLPAMTGTRTGTAIFTTGASTVIVATNCTLAIGAQGIGALAGNDLVELSLSASLSADTTASNGLPSNCAAYQGTNYQMVPFPTLSPSTTNGTCAFALSGPFARQ